MIGILNDRISIENIKKYTGFTEKEIKQLMNHDTDGNGKEVASVTFQVNR